MTNRNYSSNIFQTHLVLFVDYSRISKSKCKTRFNEFLRDLSINQESEDIHYKEEKNCCNIESL